MAKKNKKLGVGKKIVAGAIATAAVVGVVTWGEMRPKDFASALEVGRFIQKKPTPDLSEESYQNFHKFSKQIRRPSIHPHAIMNELSRWYHTTKLGKVLPLTSPTIRKVVLHIWDAAGLIAK